VRFYDKSLLQIILLRTLYLFLVCGATLAVVAYLNFLFDVRARTIDPSRTTALQYIFSATVRLLMVGALIGNLFLSVFHTLRSKIGYQDFGNLLLGRYRTPREEQRAFTFLDLKSSTTIAERLGHRTYSRLIQDSFRDLTDSLIETGAEVYQYVGDEAVLSWPVEKAVEDANCVRAYYLFRARLERKGARYQERYGLVPAFKAGVNMGAVTVVEVGVLKRAIVYHSDVLNTAARIQALCNEPTSTTNPCSSPTTCARGCRGTPTASSRSVTSCSRGSHGRSRYSRSASRPRKVSRPGRRAGMKITVNGIATHYTVDGPEHAAVVTLSHSLATDLGMWAPTLPALTRRWRVLRYDTRGHGGTDAPGGAYTLEQLADDAIALLRALGVPTTHWVGLSMGGMIGQTLALKAPGMVASLSLCDTTSRVPPEAKGTWDERIRTAESQGMEPLVEPTLARWFTPAFRERRRDVVDQVARMIRTTPVAGYVGCCRAIAALDLTERLGEITAPTAVIVGEDDPGTPVAASRVIHERIKGSRLTIIPAAAHLANMEQPEAFNHALTGFLDARG
jgi:3-oxoadipate enol-lactonase